MNSKCIGTCENCDQAYCIECSDAEEYLRFCSKVCEWENKK